MEEKKLTDEGIVKALECCVKEEHKDCVHCGEFVSQFDCMRNAISNALDLIHRLQEDNENYDRANSELICKISEQKAYIELLTKVLGSSKRKTKILDLQREIERLTEELKNCGQELIDSYREQEELQDQNAELQRQIEAWKDKSRELDEAWEIASSNEEKLRKQVNELKERLHMIFALGFDYDGCDKAESLKELIDELVSITQMNSKEFADYYKGVEVE